MIVAEGGVRDAGEPVRLLRVYIFPVGFEARRVGSVRSKEEGVQLVDDLLADAGLKLPGKEGGSGHLLWTNPNKDTDNDALQGATETTDKNYRPHQTQTPESCCVFLFFFSSSSVSKPLAKGEVRLSVSMLMANFNSDGVQTLLNAVFPCLTLEYFKILTLAICA